MKCPPVGPFTWTFLYHSEILGYWRPLHVIPASSLKFWVQLRWRIKSDSLELWHHRVQSLCFFPQKTVSVIFWHLDFFFHKGPVALSVKRIGPKHSRSIKAARQIPLTETLSGCQRMCCSPLCDWTGSTLVFHCLLWKMNFPWVVAYSQVHVFSCPW